MKTMLMMMAAALAGCGGKANDELRMTNDEWRDDEPDGLSWETIFQDREILLDFAAWAATNPPPEGIEIPKPAPPDETPVVWVKPTQLPFRSTSQTEIRKGWITNTVAGVEVVWNWAYCASARFYQTIEVPEDGVYRFWIRYRHQMGKTESNFFQLFPEPDCDDPAKLPDDAAFAVMEQTFARANAFRGGIGYKRPLNPLPEICDVETPPGDGFMWEATRKTAFLKKGRYTVKFQAGVVTTPRADICVSDYVLIGDPLLTPEEVENMGTRLPASSRGRADEARCLVPMANAPCQRRVEGNAPYQMADAPYQVRAYLSRYRAHLYDKLAAAEHGKDYHWGNLAALPAFDEKRNAVGRITQLRRLADRERGKLPYTYKAAASEFDATGGWIAETGRYDRVQTVDSLFLHGTKQGAATWRLNVEHAGDYHLWTKIFQPAIVTGFHRGAFAVSVAAGGKTLARWYVGNEDGGVVSDAAHDGEDGDGGGQTAMGANERHVISRVVWNRSPSAIRLPAGEATIMVEGADAPWRPEKTRGAWGRIFCRAVLTARDDFNPELEHETPWGDRIGDGDVGFWRSPDPWAAFSRFSPAATGRYLLRSGGDVAYRTYEWTPIADGEIDRAEHTLAAARGEVATEMIVFRNNTGEPVTAKPVLSGDLPAKCRVVAWSPVEQDGEWVPRFLLARSEVTLPPYQNTALWINIDCRGAAEGTHEVALDFAGKRHVWRVEVAGSIEETPNPWCYLWSNLPARRSCWELYRDLGINVVHVAGDRPGDRISKATAEKYGIRMFRAFASSVKDDYGTNLTRAVKADVADWKRRGFGYRDFCYSLSDEPGFGEMAKWVGIAKEIKAGDPEARIWCNTGWFPTEEQWDASAEFMGYWDVFCPFSHAFQPKAGRRADRLEAYKRIGDPRLGYITPSTSIYWIADGAYNSLEFAELCREAGRDGWSLVRMETCTGWDTTHPRLQAFFAGAWGRMVSTRYAEAVREANQRWRKALVGRTVPSPPHDPLVGRLAPKPPLVGRPSPPQAPHGALRATRPTDGKAVAK